VLLKVDRRLGVKLKRRTGVDCVSLKLGMLNLGLGLDEKVEGLKKLMKGWNWNWY